MNEIPSVEVEEVLRLAEALEFSDDEVSIREQLPSFFHYLEVTLGVTITNDVTNLYAHMKEKQCLGRIEHISRIVKALEKNIPFEIGKGDTHYANAVIPEPEGISLAFGEGQAPGPIRIMIGFGKTLVGFTTDNISVSNVDFIEDDFRDTQKRTYLCRHVDGQLSKEDIKTVVVRIPRKLVALENLFDDEKEVSSPFVFRGFLI